MTMQLKGTPRKVEPELHVDAALVCHELVGMLHDRITALREKRDRGDVGADVDLLALEQDLSLLLFSFGDAQPGADNDVE